jgi:glycosyltransferase involved in cell wall biosynthesis
LRVLVCPADRGGCGYYRLIWPARAVGVRVLDEGEEFAAGMFALDDDGTEHCVGLHTLPEADVVVMQRTAQRTQVEMIPLLQAAGIAVVIDVDDDFSVIPPDNVAHASYDPAQNPDRNHEHLRAACELADLVTCTTPALAHRYAPHGRYAILPNCVPEKYLQERQVRRLAGRDWNSTMKLKVGWTGSIDTHPGDLEVTQGAVGSVMREHQSVAFFRVIGTGKGVREALALPRGVNFSDWLPIELYPRALVDLDIGLVPLRRCAFNRAKSWLKGLEMAAVGVPFIASHTPDYERLAKLGAGILAAKPQDWTRELRRLLQSPAMRDDVAARGMRVAREFTIEKNSYAWLDAWSRASAIRRTAAA